jgi:cation-transporting ATPase 13A1
MSAICRIREKTVVSYRILTKGAPEVLKKFMINLPKDYDEQYLHYVKDGARVLVLAQKVLENGDSMKQAEFNAYKREQAESDLEFVGFIIADCPLKPDTKALIQELRESNHEVKMITGDN